MQRKYNLFNIILVLIIIQSLLNPSLVLANGSLHRLDNQEKISQQFLNEFSTNDQQLTFIIKLREQTNTGEVAEIAKEGAERSRASLQEIEEVKHEAVISALKDTSNESQQDVLGYLEEQVKAGNARNIRPYYIINGIVVTATKEVAEEVSTYSEVEKILANETRYLHETTKTDENVSMQNAVQNIEWNIDRVGAPEAWSSGFDGTGVVVATIDSGVDWEHPALKEKYRGYNAETGKVNHQYSWFDAVKEKNKVPYDPDGHGTHVTGTIVGGEPNGSNQIGVAPGAKWIAVKAFGDDGSATDADLLEAAQWILSPTDEAGNERPDLAPDIVNNSWGGGKGHDEWYREVVKAWKAAGIFPVFAAGNTTLNNTGGPGSVEVPANYPESFAVGATDQDNHLASFSLLGPSPYKEIKPDVTAPGVGIRSSLPNSSYGRLNGTSMAGPAVAGVVALLYQAAPDLSIDQMSEILKNTAIRLKDRKYPGYPNNGYGYGLVQAMPALTAVLAAGKEPVTRIAGYLRYDTAIEVSRNGWNSADTVILTRGDNFADALAGVPLASKLDAPMLLTPSNKQLYAQTLREIKRLRASNVIILGGEVAVKKAVAEELKKEGINVRRISGNSRADTAALIASEVSPEGIDKVVIANGYDFPDALSIAAYAAKAGMPILLTESKKLPISTKAAIGKLKAKQTIVVGGKLVVNESLMKQLPNAVRISGQDRYKTNIEIAKYFGITNKHMYVATGKNYADALTGAVLAAKNNSAILLVHQTIPEITSTYIKNQALERLTIFGGNVAIKAEQENQLKQLLAK
ncbi:hypothetical protein CWR48_00435 [Oceanobacillus arenosus]|uniref:Peptidase S8/S53 domain-containing protein n=1 Tax=Oceanobacillus arenosus TaxID=1229153 RepID=A0A3D8Q2P6_9BACI|nr:S8 family serine peptidase [Oceanobacillus arenosus]RDW22207.1 hypothetical protein CWR48_00435 [Oceanobacillus arenosus]